MLVRGRAAVCSQGLSGEFHYNGWKLLAINYNKLVRQFAILERVSVVVFSHSETSTDLKETP